MKSCLAVAALAAVVGCGCSTTSGTSSSSRVATQQDIMQLNGTPGRVTRDMSGNEVWIYPRSDGSSLIVTLNRDGTVKSQTMKPATR